MSTSVVFFFFFFSLVFVLSDKKIHFCLSSFDLYYLAILTHALGAPLLSFLITFASLLVPSWLLLTHS